jgi:hypothetical protein
MKRLLRGLAPLALAVGLAGCSPGLIYTNVTIPLDRNLDKTTAQPLTGESDWKTFAYIVRFDWDSAAIADAAHAAGIKEISYADLEIFSILGIWQQRTAIVYGK